MIVYMKFEVSDDERPPTITELLRRSADEIQNCMLGQLFRDPITVPEHNAVGEIMWDIVNNGEPVPRNSWWGTR